MHDPQNILVLRLGGIGEILVITPALRAIRERYPQAHITFLGEDPAVESIRALNVVDQIITANSVYRAQGWFWLISPFFYVHLLRLMRKVLSRRYDLFLNFNHLYNRLSVLKPFLISLLSRAPRRIGFDSFGRGFFLTDRIPDRRDESRHLLYRNKEFLAPLGIIPSEQVEIAIRGHEQALADQMAAEWELTSESFVVGVHAGSSRPASRWNPERLVKVLNQLIKTHQARIVLVGTTGERKLCDAIQKSVPGSINTAGKTSLGSLAALIKYFDLFISNDTGPMHIARAQGVPTVGLFGPGEYPIWGTYLDPTFVSIRRPVPCSPCYRYTCSHQTCMQLIEPKDVFEAVDQVLTHENSTRT